MGKIIFVSFDGDPQEAPLVAGQSLMQIATSNGIAGIDGDCGGECACGTCHVIVADDWIDIVGEPGEDEDQMLDMNPEREPTSRLSCQIKATAEMDGISVRLPEFQM